MNDVNLDKLSTSTKKTFDMVKTAIRSNVYPAHPDLVLSSNDSTIFAFEGNAHGEEGDMK